MAAVLATPTPLRTAALVAADRYGAIVPSPLVSAAAAAKPASADALLRLIKPEARERWTAVSQRGVTPERVEQILRAGLSGSFLGQWELFDLMEDTWFRCKKNLNELKRSVVPGSVDWSSTPFVAEGAKEPSPRAKEKAALLTKALWGCRPFVPADENSFEDAVYDCCDAIGKSISIQETLWELRDGAILPRAWQWVHPRHYGYPHDQPDLQLDPEGLGVKWQPFPPDQFVLATFKTKTGHLLSAALLRSLATFWIGANFAYDWALNLAQIFGLPFRWATYDPQINPRVLDDLCEMLQNMGSAGWGAFPHGTTLEMKEALSNAANNPQSWLMQVADLACDLLILGQTLTSDAGDRGTQALGTVHKSVRGDIIAFCGTWAAKVFQYQFVSPLMRLNYGDNDEDPTLVADVEPEEDGKSKADRDKVLVVDMRMPVKKSWLYERHDVPMPEAGDDVFEVTPPAPPVLPGQPGAGAPPPGQKPKPGAPVKAKAAAGPDDATAQLTARVLEDTTGISARWLGGVQPIFASLLTSARAGGVSDAQLIEAIELARDAMPDLFDHLDTLAVADALERAMGPAAVNGAVLADLRMRRTATNPERRPLEP